MVALYASRSSRSTRIFIGSETASVCACEAAALPGRTNAYEMRPVTKTQPAAIISFDRTSCLHSDQLGPKTFTIGHQINVPGVPTLLPRHRSVCSAYPG